MSIKTRVARLEPRSVEQLRAKLAQLEAETRKWVDEHRTRDECAAFALRVGSWTDDDLMRFFDGFPEQLDRAHDQVVSALVKPGVMSEDNCMQFFFDYLVRKLTEDELRQFEAGNMPLGEVK